MNKEFLKLLLSTHTPNGFEKEGIFVFGEYLDSCTNYEFSDNINNYGVSVGNGDINVMLSAHIDEIALRVQYIDDDGFIYFIMNGGVDQKVLLGSRVTILTRKNGFIGNFINGVIGKTPTHIEYYSENKDKVTKITDMKIDCGFSSKEEAIASGISIGNHIIINGEYSELGMNRFSSRGCDDKVGVFIVAEVMKLLSKHTLNKIKVWGVCCTQEETTASGAIASAQRIDPQYSIDLDVTFATDDGYVEKKEYGDVKLGKGGCIVHSPDCNEDFVDLTKEVFQTNNIPFQEFSLDGCMTNTNPIKQSSSDCKNVLLSIPLRNMHTQVEVCDFRDLDSLIQGIYHTILKIENNIN